MTYHIYEYHNLGFQDITDLSEAYINISNSEADCYSLVI